MPPSVQLSNRASTPPPTGKATASRAIIAGTIIGTVLLLSIGAFFLMRRKRASSKETATGTKTQDVRRGFNLGHRPTPSDQVSLSPLLANPPSTGHPRDHSYENSISTEKAHP